MAYASPHVLRDVDKKDYVVFWKHNCKLWKNININLLSWVTSQIIGYNFKFIVLSVYLALYWKSQKTYAFSVTFNVNTLSLLLSLNFKLHTSYTVIILDLYVVQSQ